MTEDSGATPAAAPQQTGIAPLDAVLGEVAQLDDRPLSEHVAVFEAAHTELRRPLDSPPAELADPPHPHAD